MATRHLNQVELSRRWSLSPRTLERWRYNGTGPRFIKLGCRVVYRISDVEDYERAQVQGKPPRRPPVGAAR